MKQEGTVTLAMGAKVFIGLFFLTIITSVGLLVFMPSEEYEFKKDYIQIDKPVRFDIASLEPERFDIASLEPERFDIASLEPIPMNCGKEVYKRYDWDGELKLYYTRKVCD